MRSDPDLLSVTAAAREAGAQPAIFAGEETLSWSQVATRVTAIVAELEARQAAKTVDLLRVPAVALLGDTDLATVLVLLAAVERGIPVLLLHPRSTAAERQALLELYAVPLLDAAALAGAPPATDGGARSASGSPRVEAGRCLAVVRTSGSSGGPKGVVLSRRAMLAAAVASAGNLDWLDGDRWLLQMATSHVGGLSIVVRCLVARKAMVLAPMGLDAAALVDLAGRQGVTLLSLVPTVLHRLVEAGLAPPPGLRAVLLGGAATSRRLLAAGLDAGWPLLTTYGLSETCGQVATQSPQRLRGDITEDAGALLGEPGCGPPLPGVELRIVGAEGRGPGAIEVFGETLMDGYLPAGDSWPFTADGWLVTGDLGRLDRAGNLHVLGRRDEVISSGGENVHPLEVEEALVAHPGVAAACVFGVADEEWGEQVAAALVATGEEPGGGDLRSFLETRLAPFRRPRRVAWLEALPQTPGGKLDRRAVAALAAGHLRPL